MGESQVSSGRRKEPVRKNCGKCVLMCRLNWVNSLRATKSTPMAAFSHSPEAFTSHFWTGSFGTLDENHAKFSLG